MKINIKDDIKIGDFITMDYDYENNVTNYGIAKSKIGTSIEGIATKNYKAGDIISI